MRWSFHEGESAKADVQDLLLHHFQSMRAISPPDACHVLPAERVSEEGMTLFSLRDEDGTLLGIGALKELAPDHGEVKSMRTAARALGRGVGRTVLHRIIQEARVRGYRRLSLETGSTEPFAAALRLYESEGFGPCGPFGGYSDTPFTRFFTRDL